MKHPSQLDITVNELDALKYLNLKSDPALENGQSRGYYSLTLSESNDGKLNVSIMREGGTAVVVYSRSKYKRTARSMTAKVNDVMADTLASVKDPAY